MDFQFRKGKKTKKMIMSNICDFMGSYLPNVTNFASSGNKEMIVIGLSDIISFMGSYPPNVTSFASSGPA